MGNISESLGGSFKRKSTKSLSPEHQFLNKIQDCGLTPPDEVVMDGNVHRFKSGSKRDRSGWYLLYPTIDNLTVGLIGDWRLGIEEKFIAETDKELTTLEKMNVSKKMEEAKKLRDEAKAKQYEVNADVVDKIWQSAILADENHTYLKRKGIESHGIKVTGDGRLVIPLFTEEGTLASLQYIDTVGNKQFHHGGKTGGCSFYIGNPNSQVIYLAEGFADAATIVEETGQCCYVAFSGANMIKIAHQIKNSVSNRKNTEIIVVSDNDEHGKGQEYAKQASDAINATLIIPPQEGDINDYRSNGGDVKSVLEPSTESDWLDHADDLCSQPAPINWLVKGWLQEQALCMVHGQSGSGKTFLVLDMILSIASGKSEWCGHKVKEGNVIYLAGEGHHGLRARLAGWKQNNETDSMNLWVSKTGLDLNSSDGYIKTVKAIQSTHKSPSIIVVDTLHRFLNGDENSAQDAKSMLDACAGLMHEFNCTVLLVHHTGVSELAKERARGSSAWRGALDIEISVQPQDKKGNKPMEVKQMKSKDAELQESKFFTLDRLPIDGWYDEDGEQVNTAILSVAEKPVESIAPVKTRTHINTMKHIWEYAGKPRDGKNPMFTRQDVIAYLTDSGKTEANAKQETKPSVKGRLIHELINNKIIQKKDEHYIMIDPATLSIINLENN